MCFISLTEIPDTVQIQKSISKRHSTALEAGTKTRNKIYGFGGTKLIHFSSVVAFSNLNSKILTFEHQRIQEEKRVREAEIKRREAERKIRHERLIHDGKKSFFELNQLAAADAQAEQKSLNATALEDGKDNTQDTEHVPIEKNAVEKQLPIVDDTKDDDLLSKNENDLNALDYEADKDMDEPETSVTVQRVEIQRRKSNERSSKLDKHGGGGGGSDEKSNKKNDDTKKADRRRRSRSRDKRSKDRDRRHNSRGRNDRRMYNRRRDYSPPHNRDNRRRDARRNQRNRSSSRRRNRDSR